MRRALLVIDMQAVVVAAVWRGEELVERIATLVREARAHDVPVVAIQQVGAPSSPFDPASPGWPLAPGLGIRESDVHVRKTATDSFFRTDLAALLTERGVDAVVITGAATDYCVDATARAALSHGLDVVLVSDGHAPAPDPAGLAPEQIIDHHNRILAAAIHPGGTLRLCRAAEVFA